MDDISEAKRKVSIQDHIHKLMRAPKRIGELPRKVRIVSLVAIVLAAGLFYMFGAPGHFPKGVVVTVEKGQSLKEVGTILKEENIVRSRTAFVSLVTILGSERRIPPGDYYFPHAATVFSIASHFARGDHNMDPVKVTIPEGSNSREISRILGERMPGFDAESFKTKAITNEGYLFPETYFFYPRTKPENILTDMREMFDAQTAAFFEPLDLSKEGKAKIIIIASILEREARGDVDRDIISGIIANRLKRGMPLQVDASIAYAVGVPDSLLTKADFSIDSPYNTYKYRGLPPGPISNPGLKALQAAENPKETDYLYYLHGHDGVARYAKTYAEHQKNIARYLK